MGCVTRPKQHTQHTSDNTSTGRDKIFKLDDLELIKTTAHPYLMVSTYVHVSLHECMCACSLFVFYASHFIDSCLPPSLVPLFSSLVSLLSSSLPLTIPLTLHPFYPPSFPLQPSVSSYRKIFIFVSADKSRNSGLATVGIFICDKSTGDDYIPEKNTNKRYYIITYTLLFRFYMDTLRNDLCFDHVYFCFLTPCNFIICQFLISLLMLSFLFFCSHSMSNKNPYSDDPAPATIAPAPLSGRSYVWLCTGNSSGLDARPPMQRIYRK
jgi:hypothetical protein